ncbi:MAG: hypothetical protein ACREBC_08095, partial [Pyrinomonadaceae bacterium]
NALWRCERYVDQNDSGSPASMMPAANKLQTNQLNDPLKHTKSLEIKRFLFVLFRVMRVDRASFFSI